MMAAYLEYVVVVYLLIASAASLNTVQEHRLDALEEGIVMISKENEELHDLVMTLKEDLEEERIKNKEMTIELQSIQERLSSEICSQKKNDVSKRQQGQLTTQWVAFSAVIQHVDLTNLRSGQAIVFDKVISNMASAYDATSGIFTAPIRGLYVFNMDVMVEPSHNEYLEFVKDGSHVMYNYVHAQGGLDDVSSSRSVVLELTAGNQFWVRVTQITNHGSGTVHGNGFTTFSGYLLRIIE